MMLLTAAARQTCSATDREPVARLLGSAPRASLAWLCCVLTGDVHELDEEAEEAHHQEADGRSKSNLLELANTQIQAEASRSISIDAAMNSASPCPVFLC